MTWMWSFSCDASLKSILKFFRLFSLSLSWYCLALHSNIDLATLPGPITSQYSLTLNVQVCRSSFTGLWCAFVLGHPSCCVAVRFIFVVELQFLVYV